MISEFSHQMHDQTERPGQSFPTDTHQIIKHRYNMAADLAVGKSVLEIGAGHGIAARMLSNRASYYVAGEYSDENIDMLAKRKPYSPAVQFDAHHLPFKEDKFDLIVMMAMVYYLDLHKFIEQASSVLKTGGSIFFCTSNKDVPGFVPAPYTTQYYSIPEMRKIFDMKGFNISFKGAFPAQGGSYIKRKIKAVMKSTAKSFIHGLPNGRNVWYKLRQQHIGQGEPLPWHVDEIKSQDVEVHDLPSDRVNHDFRIIYGIATKQ